MKSFRTELKVTPSPIRLRPTTPLLTIGSCFSDEVGLKLKSNKFNVLVNPAKPVYSPLAAHKILTYAATGTIPNDYSYQQINDLWSHPDFHSSFSGLSQLSVANGIGSSLAEIRAALPATIIITYGTAWIFRDLKSGEAVANCHKAEAARFSKELLSVEEICNSFERLLLMLENRFPGTRVILTLSPVRHIKDTIELNSVSKSVLRTAIHHIIADHQQVGYFPAYEIMMDDLRDYRFYKSDMLHPSAEAIDYCWDKFGDQYFDADVKAFILKWQNISASLSHKAFNPESRMHQQFLRNLLAGLSELKDLIDVSEEIAYVSSQIAKADHEG